MKQGKVKWFSDARGYGFIESEGKDYFVHFKSIMTNDNFKTLKNDSIVTFEVRASDKGDCADNVQYK